MGLAKKASAAWDVDWSTLSQVNLQTQGNGPGGIARNLSLAPRRGKEQQEQDETVSKRGGSQPVDGYS